MVFDWFKKLGGNKKRPRDTGDRNAVIRRVVAAAADEAKQRDELLAARPADAKPPADAPAPPAEPARKPASVTVATPSPRPAAGPDIPSDQIARRAYEIWVRKGQPAGTADQDWLEAEAELRAELLGRPAARSR